MAIKVFSIPTDKIGFVFELGPKLWIKTFKKIVFKIQLA